MHSLNDSGTVVICTFYLLKAQKLLYNVQLTPFNLTQKFFHHHIFDFSPNSLTPFGLPGTVSSLCSCCDNDRNQSSLVWAVTTVAWDYTGMLMAIPWRQWRLGKVSSPLSPFLNFTCSVLFVCLRLFSDYLSRPVYGSIHFRLSGQSLRIFRGGLARRSPSTVFALMVLFSHCSLSPSPPYLLSRYCTDGVRCWPGW